MQAAHKVNNNFYTEELVLGAGPLHRLHLKKLTETYPKHASFITDIYQELTEDGIMPPATLLAPFIVLKELFDNNKFGIHGENGLNASTVKFSFVQANRMGDEMFIRRFETQEQAMVRRAFLTFNMRSNCRENVQHALENYGLSMATFGDCGCCITEYSLLENLITSDIYKSQNVLRSYFNAAGCVTNMVEVETLKNIKADIHADDIFAANMLKDVVSLLVKVDKEELEGPNVSILLASEYLSGLYN